MKFFTNKSIWSKIVIILIFVLLFEFVVTKPTLASGAEVGETMIEFGGKLMGPLLSLTVSIADAAIGITQLSIMGTEESLYPIDAEASIWEVLGKAVIAIGAAIAVAVVIVGTGGLALGPTIATIAMGFAKIAAVSYVGWHIIEMATDSASSTELSKVSASYFSPKTTLPSTVYIPAFSISPEEIFQGKILLFNVNFFGNSKQIWAKGEDKDGNEISEKSSVYGTEKSKIVKLEKFYYTDDNGEEITTSSQDVASDLQETIARWYVGIRNIVLVGMMIVLLYIGIRMMLSTIASDKAKYKQLLQDWFVGLLLVFFIHYIMAFSVTLVQKLTDVVSTSVDKNTYAVEFPVDKDGKIVEWFGNDKEKGHNMTYMVYDKNQNCLGTEDGTDWKGNKDDAAYIVYPTNILGSLRLDMQMCSWGYNYIGYALVYMVLVMFTIYFVFTYLRRVLYMAFLTMIAPMVALTYPIDKVSDGSAQGFSKWFKEYIFNLLIQPMHLLLYYILVTSAFDLAGKNTIYSMVAIGFMIPAEKLLRSLFGFEKAKTPGLLAGPAGAAITMGAMQKLAHLGMPKPPKNIGGKGNGSMETDEGKLPHFKGDIDETAVMAGIGDKVPTNTDRESVGNNDIEKDQEALDDMREADRAAYEAQEAQYDIMQQEIDDRRERELLEEQANSDEGDINSKVTSPNIGIVEQPKRKLRNNPKFIKAQEMGLNGLRKFSRSRIPGTIVRSAGRVAGGVVAGSLGAATGIVSGSPSQAFTNAMAAGSAGYIGAKNITNGITESWQDTSGIDRKYEQLRQDNEQFDALAEARQIKDNRKEYKKALKKNNFDKEEINKMVNDGTIDKYIRNEVSVEDAVVGERMRKENPNMSQEDVIATSKYAKRIGDAGKGPDRKKWQEHLATEFVDKANLKQDKAQVAAKQTIDKVNKFNKSKKSFIK